MLRIRPYKPSDARYLLQWLTDETTVTFWKADRFSWPLTEEQLEKYYRDFEADSNACAFTALDENGEIAGHFSLRRIDWKENRAHMGFIIVNPDARGKGYGRRMVHQALKYAFEVLGLCYITLGVYDCNEPAKRCYAAEGFEKINRPGFEPKTDSFHGDAWEYYYLEAKRDVFRERSVVGESAF